MQLANRYGLWTFHTGAVQACIGCVAHIPKKQGKAQLVVDIEGALRKIHVRSVPRT